MISKERMEGLEEVFDPTWEESLELFNDLKKVTRDRDWWRDSNEPLQIAREVSEDHTKEMEREKEMSEQMAIIHDVIVEVLKEELEELRAWKEGKKGVEDYFRVVEELRVANLRLKEIEDSGVHVSWLDGDKT